MEESVQSDEAGRVHIHEQREVCKRLTRVSLEAFRYTTLTDVAVMPNCAPNYLEAGTYFSLPAANPVAPAILELHPILDLRG